MGCGFSETATGINPTKIFHLEPPPDQPKSDMLSSQKLGQDIKQVLWQIIEKNNVKSLAFIINHEKIHLRCEINYQGSYWTMLHMACRWNADLCVAFLLRKLYQQEPMNYVKSVNIQTVEGFTPLELTAIWGAQESFIELIEAGGLDLSLKDTKGIDIFMEAKTYKRQKMLKQLIALRDNGVLLVQANIEQLKKPLQLQDMLNKSQKQISETQEKRRKRGHGFEHRRNKNRQHYRIKRHQDFLKLQQGMRKLVQDQIQTQKQNLKKLQQFQQRASLIKAQLQRRKNEEQQNYIKNNQKKIKQQLNSIQKISIDFINSTIEKSQEKISDQQARLDKQRQKYEQEIQRQKDQFLKKQKEIQQENARQLQLLVEQQRKQEEQRLQQEMKRIQEQKKQAQLKKKQEEERKRKQLEQLKNKQQQEQIQRFLKKQQQERKQKQRQQKEKLRIIQENKRIYEEQLQAKKKQVIKKSTQIIQPLVQDLSPQKGKSTRGVGTLPKQLEQLYNQALTKGTNFIDSKFPPKKQTLGTPKKVSKAVETSVWYRPSQIFGSSYQLFDGIDPDDIKQGSLGVCYYLATLSSLAEKPDRIRKMFTFYDKELGFYVVSLYINGAPTNIVVDDFFPCSKGTKQPLFTKPNGKQIWVMVLEKAWVKNFGNYFAAEGMVTDIMMQDVSGAPSKGVHIKNISSQLAFLASCHKNKYISVLSSLNENVPKGIVSGHAYTLMDVYHQMNPQLLKIRNPWGSFQWQGQYGDKSQKWNNELKQKLNVKDSQDGIFFMTPKQIPIGFSYYSVSMIKQNGKFQYIDFTSKPAQQKFWIFKINQKGDVNIRITQPFDRLVSEKNYHYSPLIFEFGRIKSDKQIEFLGEGNQNTIFGEKSVHFHEDLFVNLEPGEYFIRVKIFWNSQKYRSARLISYSQLDIILTQKTVQQMKPKWIQSIVSLLPQFPKSSMLSNTVSLMQKWMKGQFVMGIQNNHTATTYIITIELTQKDFKKCQLTYGKTSTNTVKVTVAPGQIKVAAIADKTQLNAASSIGKFSISATAKR